eukprot:scaffold206637_cov55-Attheya_sp.AAC.1
MVPFFGCMLDSHSVHHNSHIGKVMCLVMTAFAPYNNNFEKGGCAYKVDCVRIGGMVKVKKDAYHRVYRNDGTYHYPRNPDNICDGRVRHTLRAGRSGADRQCNTSPRWQTERVLGCELAVSLSATQFTSYKLNVQDAAVFPAMAKCGVMETQGLFNRGRYLQDEALWDAIEKVWNEFPEETLARAYVHHGQM